jgi:16S rRNA (uracil1498-N3)-methyltransferase
MPATPAWPPNSAPRLFVAGPLALAAALSIDGPQGQYLARVMRVTAGDGIVLCDDLTGAWAARVVAADKRSVSVLVESLLAPREQVPDFTLCAALLKKDRFDLVLEKACELGVRAVQPVLTRRCVADKLNLDRARSILIEAAEQCARTALPALLVPIKLDALLKGWQMDRRLFFADEAGGANAAQVFAAMPGPGALITGPEGGFDVAERAAIRALPQAQAVTLGPRVLRGETAAIAGTALWMGVSGDWQNGCEKR